ncbi:TniB family NTP-binding protein [Rhodopseudomonas pseudopalustris]|uniref:TniB family NTP-binding protein n=1 Tax=Rhodopseudomonas pseudopalustris TaxID=1513892 RepID=UPI003F982224
MSKPLPIEQSTERLKKFDAILIKHPRMVAIERAVQSLMAQGKAVVEENARRAAATNGRSFVTAELWCLPIIGPSGATKSTSIRQVVAAINGDPSLPPEAMPILYVKMNSNIRNPRQFQAQILASFGDASAASVMASAVGWNAAVVNDGILRIARRKQTLIIVIDEIHAVLAHDGGKVALQMSKTLQSLINAAAFSVVMVGTDEMKRFFKANPELQTRGQVRPEISMAPFEIRDPEQREYFFRFVGRLEKRMLADGVIDEPMRLLDDVATRAAVFDMSGGVVGIVSRLMRLALMRAHDYGRTTPTMQDLSTVFAAWNATRENPGFDPFVNGPQHLTVQHLKNDLKQPS